MSKSALILTGPLDGKLTDHTGDTLMIPILPELPVGPYDPEADIPLEIETLVFKRVTYKLPCSLFVPIEWTRGWDQSFLDGMILGHLLTKAFKGATGIRQDGQG